MSPDPYFLQYILKSYILPVAEHIFVIFLTMCAGGELVAYLLLPHIIWAGRFLSKHPPYSSTLLCSSLSPLLFPLSAIVACFTVPCWIHANRTISEIINNMLFGYGNKKSTFSPKEFPCNSHICFQTKTISFLLSELCPKDEQIILLLAESNIPIVLNLNPHDREIYVYISSNVERHILKPLFKNKALNNRVICSISYPIQIVRNDEDFKIILHKGTHTTTDMYFIILKNPKVDCIRSVLPQQEYQSTFYGIKDKKMKSYSAWWTDSVLKRNYLL